MKKLSTFQKGIIIALVFALCCVFVISRLGHLQQGDGAVTGQEPIRFSQDSAFYNKDITVELSAGSGKQIYYTLDGSEPKPDNPEAVLYGEGIRLEAADTEYSYTIRAAAYEDGALVSEENRTYIMGVNVETRFTMPVLSVTGSPEDFYNYEDGIMVHGKLDDEYIAAHPEWSEFFANDQIPIFGNFYQKGRDAEKEVFITLFDKDGNRLLSQNCGFRLYGALSRMKNQPSFRLYARSEYGEINDFDYTFFTDQYTDEDTLQSEYKRVIVRNGGNDNGYGFIRSELATRIAKESGFRDAPSASPVCVYLNGNYYGVHWFITNFDDNYFRETYGEYAGEMYIFEGEIQELAIDEEEEDSAYIGLAEEYNESMDYFENADLTIEENWQKLNSFLDVNNFIQYIAIQHYVANDDSLFNNYRVYRYYAPDGVYTPDTVFDGRYRMLLFDMDYALGLERIDVEPEKYALTTKRIDGDEAHEKLFANILKREDCRELYIKYTLSLMNYYYSESYVKSVLDEMHGSRIAELSYMIQNTDLLLDNHVAPDVTDLDYIAHQMFLIERFANLRPEYAIQDLLTAFGEMTTYTLEVENPDQAYITLDYASFSDTDYTGSYFAEVPVQVSVQPRPGYRFVHWLVNGKAVECSSFAITPDMITEGRVNITCVSEPAEDADLCISGVKAKDGDFIEITNISTENKNLGAYCLTDNESDRKSTLPASILEPGETVIIYCKNYSEVEALGQPGTNFNIKAGETVSLYRTDGRLVDSVTVPQLGSGEGVWRMDMYTGSFREVIEK